jgi:hypothetical protein
MAVERGASYRFPDANRCIYCGTTEKRLTKEHIVPLGLGGNLIFPKASCIECAKIIHVYEYTTLRTTLGVMRMRYGFPTRRKKDRPTHLDIQTSKGKLIKVPIEEYPVGAVIPNFSRASVFENNSRRGGLLEHIGRKVYLNGDLEAFMQKYDWDGRHIFKWMPYEFARMVVKICYGYAVAVLGYGMFSPICLDYILCRSDDLGYVFGQNGENNEVGGDSQIYKLDIGVYVKELGELIVVVYFSLIPSGGTPIYEVAVGKIHGAENISRLAEKLRNDGFKISAGPFV